MISIFLAFCGANKDGELTKTNKPAKPSKKISDLGITQSQTINQKNSKIPSNKISKVFYSKDQKTWFATKDKGFGLIQNEKTTLRNEKMKEGGRRNLDTEPLACKHHNYTPVLRVW